MLLPVVNSELRTTVVNWLTAVLWTKFQNVKTNCH